MKTTLLFVTLFLFSRLILAANEPEPPPPLDPKYFGIHNMVLMANGGFVYASHLPRYDFPNNVQLIYSVDVDDTALLNLIHDADLVTIKPKPFNLQQLIRGDQVTLKADVYMGHFGRGGSLTFEDMEITLEEQLYLRVLDEVVAPSNIQKYDTVFLRAKQKLLIHQIQTAPSYDHLILLYEDINCVTQFSVRSAVPSPRELHQKLSYCGPMKPLYYDTQGLTQ